MSAQPIPFTPSNPTRRGALGFSAGFALYALLLWLFLALQSALLPGGYGRQELILGLLTFLLRALAGGVGGAILGGAFGREQARAYALAGAAGYSVGGLLAGLLFAPLAAAGSSTSLLGQLILMLGPALAGAVTGACLGYEAGRGRIGRMILAGAIAFALGYIAWALANQAVKGIAVALHYPGSPGFWFLANNLLADAVQGLALGGVLGAALKAVSAPPAPAEA